METRNENGNGNKMISFTVRLHTDGLEKPGHAWTTATLEMHENNRHGIQATKPTHINVANMLQELAVEGITLYQKEKRVMPEWMQEALHSPRREYREEERKHHPTDAVPPAV